MPVLKGPSAGMRLHKLEALVAQMALYPDAWLSAHGLSGLIDESGIGLAELLLGDRAAAEVALRYARCLAGQGQFIAATSAYVPFVRCLAEQELTAEQGRWVGTCLPVYLATRWPQEFAEAEDAT